jgi:ligand-binding sensor domain-containing protein/two-component sensor histidine kinase
MDFFAWIAMVTAASGLTDGYVRAILRDSRGTLWVGTDAGLFSLRDGGFHRFVAEAIDPAWEVHSLVEDSSGAVLVGSSRPYAIRGLVVESVRLPSASAHAQVKSLLRLRDGRVLLGTTEGVFERSSAGTECKKLLFPSVDVEALLQSADGAIWAGTISNGLWRKDGSAIARISLAPVGPNASVYSLITDGSGQIWVGTQSGLIRLHETPVTLIRSPALAIDRETLAGDRAGHVFLANSTVLGLDTSVPTKVRYPLPKSSRILDLLVATDDSTWLGTAGEGVYHVLATGAVQHYTDATSPSIATDFPRGMVETPTGQILIASAFGINRFNKGRVDLLDVSNGLPNRSVRVMVSGPDGCVWIGTDGGPSEYCRGTLVQNAATRAIRGEEIWAVAIGGNGDVWFGTHSHGIFGYDGQHIRHLSTREGLLNDSICSLLVDREGQLWISTPGTLSSISSEQLHTVLSSAEPKLILVEPYLLPDFEESLRFTSGRFPNSLLDQKGGVWFSTDKGPIHIDPRDRFESHAIPPQPFIESLLADDRVVPLRKETHLPFPSGALRFSFGANSLEPDADVMVTYRLDGVERRWVVARDQMVAEYPQLSAGHYRFEVRATSREATFASAVATADIVIPTVWYKRWWFVALCLLVPGVVSLVVYSLHLQRVRDRFRSVLDERARLAREVHDTLIQGCNGVAMLLEAEASLRGSTADSGLLDSARVQLRSTVAEAREAVWNLRHSEMTWQAFLAALEQVGAQEEGQKGARVAFKLQAASIALRSDVAHEALMIVREAVANARRHALASSIQVSARPSGDGLLLEVADDVACHGRSLRHRGHAGTSTQGQPRSYDQERGWRRNHGVSRGEDRFCVKRVGIGCRDRDWARN